MWYDVAPDNGRDSSGAAVVCSYLPIRSVLWLLSSLASRTIAASPSLSASVMSAVASGRVSVGGSAAAGAAAAAAASISGDVPLAGGLAILDASTRSSQVYASSSSGRSGDQKECGLGS
jgi:hypothetical protein